MAKRGRPPKFVKDPNGNPIIGLSYDKNIGYYATYSKPRLSFGTDLHTALFRFRQYINEQKKDKPVIEIDIPPEKDLINKPGEYINWEDFDDSPPVVNEAYAGDSTFIPEILFLEEARKLILTDPISAAKKIGIPELAKLDDLPRLEKPLPLKDILDFYIDNRNPSKCEIRKARTAWKDFCKIVKVATVREITSDMIYDYRDKLLQKQRKNNWSSSWLKMRFTKVKTILNYYKKNGRTNKRELRRVIEWCECLSVSSNVEQSAQPIERDDFHKLISEADIRMKAALLLGLNCGYYAKDIHDIKKKMIKSKGDIDFIVFPREKNKHMRVNVLWKETKQALDEYMNEKPNESEYVFTSANGTPWDHDIQRGLGRLRVKVGISDKVKFSHLRDGAATALFGKVRSDLLKVTIGHRIKGEKSKYILVKPEQVQICADIIWQEYFG